MHRECQSVVKTSVRLQAALLRSHHVLTSCVRCQSTVPHKMESIYLILVTFKDLIHILERWRSGKSQYGPGSIPELGVIYELSLLLVLVLAPRGFSPGTLVFPFLSNISNISKFQFDSESEGHRSVVTECSKKGSKNFISTGWPIQLKV